MAVYLVIVFRIKICDKIKIKLGIGREKVPHLGEIKRHYSRLINIQLLLSSLIHISTFNIYDVIITQSSKRPQIDEIIFYAFNRC